jgi:hypothetical protein
MSWVKKGIFQARLHARPATGRPSRGLKQYLLDLPDSGDQEVRCRYLARINFSQNKFSYFNGDEMDERPVDMWLFYAYGKNLISVDKQSTCVSSEQSDEGPLRRVTRIRDPASSDFRETAIKVHQSRGRSGLEN